MEPWESYPAIWKSKTAFFTYLRGHIRLIWSRYPAKLKWKSAQMFKPPKGYTGRAKTMGKCAYCNETFAASHLEVDHIEQAGTCNSWETAAQFLRKLLDCNDNWCLACKPCHKIKSYAEKQGLDFEEARLQKRVIEIMKQNKSEVLDFCQRNGYNSSSLSNETKRKVAVDSILRRV
jgi:5-methylcytosine-specific restriction endonuclease McrA